MKCGQAYKGCFDILQKAQLGVASWVLAAKEVADLELALLGGCCLLGSLELVSDGGVGQDHV